MSKSSQFVSQITNFPILHQEENETGVSVLLAKFFKFGRNSPLDNSDSSNGTANATNQENAVKEPNDEENENVDIGQVSQYSDDIMEGRSVQRILKRISSLVALRTSSGTRYEDTEQARYWMRDNVSKECYECGDRFSAFRRRHHCRICGQIFCARCSSHRVPGHVCGCAGGLRACTYCCRIVLGYLQSVDSGTILSADLKALQDNLKEKVNSDNTQSPEQGFLLGGNEVTKDGIGDLSAESPFTRNISLQDTFRHLCLSLPLQQHRYRLVRYSGVWRGGDVIQWLIDHGNIPTRVQASEMCQTFMKEGLIECVTEHQYFIDYGLYRPINMPVLSTAECDQNSLRGSISSYCLNLNLAENTAHLVRGQKTGDNLALQAEDDHMPLQSDGQENKLCCEIVEASGVEHLKILAVQGLTRAGLNLNWAPVLLTLCQQVANMIIPDVTNNEWDIRRCVRVKRVAGGLMRESHAIGGLVFTKNVAHRGMSKRLVHPRILLLRCSLVFQRVENKLISLEPVLMQEQEYLRNCCGRIIDLAPDVIVVQGSVSRTAQDELRNHGKVLVIGVRGPTLQRLARCTNADIITSVDARIGAPRLGTCKAFYLLNHDSKTLMVFEDDDKNLKGSSIILRGGSLEELSRVKKVTSFLLLASYNWRLESFLLGDMTATLPISNAPLIFTDNSKDNSPDKDCKSSDNIDDLDETIGINQLGMDKAEKKKEMDTLKIIDKSKNEISIKESKLSTAIIDPLTSDYFYKILNEQKKNDSEKVPTLSCGITVDDFSDPLRSRKLSFDDDVFISQRTINKENIIENKIDEDILKNRWSADEAVLSISPHIKIYIPYLENDVGRNCPLRHYYCTPLFPLPTKPMPSTPKPLNKLKVRNNEKKLQQFPFKRSHPFITKPLVHGAEGVDVRTMLAHYRAFGGCWHNGSLKNKTISVVQDINKDEKIVDNRLTDVNDPLDPERHQRIYFLFYSYCLRSPNVPDFCINPSIAKMEMYGNNDLSLGQFLERHCFAQQYICPSQSCRIPLMHHVRNFVHGDGCVTVTCVAIESSAPMGAQNLLIDEEGKHSIMWWCRCMACAERVGSSSSSCIRPISLAISLAKYLELRFNAPRYIKKDSCGHSLHQHFAHYFACGNITACFRYRKIKSWDIFLPPHSIATYYNTRKIRDCLINQVNDLILKGHEVFSNLSDVEHEKEQSHFKLHTERIQLDLTSSSLQEQTNNAGIIRSLWNISDAIVIGEKLLQDTLEKWTTQTNLKANFKSIPENMIDQKSENEDNPQNDQNLCESSTDIKSSTNSCDLENIEEEEEKGERRGLRTIITQLLSNSQPAHQNGIVLCGGVIPVVVRASEISSIVAAALASPQYHQQLNSSLQLKGYCTDSDDMASSKERLEGDGKSKGSKSCDHIDVQLQDGLFCCIYYPKQFLKLRNTLLCPLQANANITNSFDLKHVNQDSIVAKNNDQSLDCLNACNEMHAATQEELSKQLLFEERDITSAEASPIMSLKKSSDEKYKKSCQNTYTKINFEVNEVEEGFIRSLSRCVPWAARGGKSGSTFCKTKDDRYILKEMSKLELQLFIELALDYFQYIQTCEQNNLPTLLTRIVGVYRVGGLEGVSGGVLIMENLWHGRTGLIQKFDLKGAQRNRLAEPGSPDVVLLDENLLNFRLESPLFLQSHSANVLWAAIDRDTTFLSSHQIMDYSLLVGLDEEKNELVLGVIDYIRTFTWDKKLEHIVKKGLGSGLPTIVSPDNYKSRFCGAMKKYFLQSPNQWEELDRGLICDTVENC